MDYYKMKLMPGNIWVETTKRWQIVKLSMGGSHSIDSDWEPIPGEENLTYQEAMERIAAYEQAQLSLQNST